MAVQCASVEQRSRLVVKLIPPGLLLAMTTNSRWNGSAPMYVQSATRSGIRSAIRSMPRFRRQGSLLVWLIAGVHPRVFQSLKVRRNLFQSLRRPIQSRNPPTIDNAPVAGSGMTTTRLSSDQPKVGISTRIRSVHSLPK